jgi:hypothetical protein
MAGTVTYPMHVSSIDRTRNGSEMRQSFPGALENVSSSGTRAVIFIHGHQHQGADETGANGRKLDA